MNFAAFLAVCFPQTQGGAYRLTPFHLYLADLAQAMADGTAPRRQTVSCPPQHGKSRLLAVRLVAWLLGRFPGVHIALTGFSHQLIVDFIAEARDVMRLAVYDRIFPGIHPMFGRERNNSVFFNNGATVLGRSCGSKLTGRRVDWLIIDDAHSGRAEAESPVKRRSIVQWFFGDCMTRLTPEAKVLLIGTRFHPQDLIGHLTGEDYVQQLRNEGQEGLIFHKVNLKAISDGINDPLGRAEGEALCPEVKPLSFLVGQRAGGVLSYEWDSQYQGTPRAAGGNQVDLSKLLTVEPDQVPIGVRQARGWDLAITEDQTADFTAGARIAFDPVDEMLYIMDIFKQRMAWAKLRATMVRKTLEDKDLHNIHKIGIEAVAGFDAVYREVQELVRGKVIVEKKNPPRGGKLMRAQAWLAMIEGGRVRLVRGAWNRDFREELEQFPEGTHDDQVDAVSIAYEVLFKARQGILLS